MRAFMWLTRPVLRTLNALANVSLHRLGVELVDELTQARDPQTLRELVSHSGEAGTLDEERRHRLLGTLDLDDLTVGSLLAERDRPPGPADGVAADDSPHAIRQAARRSGHLRLLVYRDGDPVGVVHVRDVLTAGPGTTAQRVMRPLLVVESDEPAHRALDTLRAKHTQIALVSSDGRPVGVITMQDVVNRLLREPPAQV